MPEIPDEAVRLAMAARDHALLDRPDPMVLSDEALTRQMLAAALPALLSRDHVITALAAAFGPHKSYAAATRTYEPDGNDAEGSCTISFLADDSCMSLRTLTYGEIADALAVNNRCPRCSGQAPNVCTCPEPCGHADCAGKERSGG